MYFTHKKYEDRVLPYVIAFFASMNFFKLGAVLWLVYTAMSIIEKLLSRKAVVLRKDWNLAVCVLFTVSAVFASFLHFGGEEIVKAFLMLTSWMAGCWNYQRAADKKTYIFRIIVVIVSAYLAQIILLYIRNLEFSITGQRLLISLWEKKYISVTAVGAMCSIVIGFSAHLLLGQKKKLWKVFAVACMLFTVLINMKTATRTPFVLMGVVFMLSLVYFLTQPPKTRQVKMMLVAVGVFLVLVILWLVDFCGLATWVQNSSIYIRFSEENLESTRIEIAIQHIAKTFTHLWGGGKIHEELGNYAHNIIQEGHDLYGIGAGIAMLLFVLFAIINYVKLFKNKTTDQTVSLFRCIYPVILLQLLVEPTLEGYPLLFWNFVFIHAMTTMYLGDTAKKREVLCGEKQ